MVHYIVVFACAIFFITCLNGSEGLNHFPVGEINVTRYRRQATCKKYEFKCDNNICISDTDLCDGIAQCEDGSDETIHQCSNLQCPPYTFMCAYGACIDKKYRCNGMKNCVDNSDEQGCPTPTTERHVARPTSNVQPDADGCILPNHIPNGFWTVLGPSGYNPGDPVKSRTSIEFDCNPNYKLYPELMGFALYRKCLNGNWGGDFPICIKTCKSILPNERMNVDCFYKGGKTDCNDPYEGSNVLIRCKDLYADNTLTDNPQRNCIDGDWDYSPPTCDYDCGHKSVRPTLLGGKVTEKAEYPWQAAIYLEKEHICGGSIISKKVILSAAHCFKSKDWRKYQIGVGKLYRTYEDARDTDAQYRDVQEVIIQQEFHDGAYLTFDIALIIVKKELQITNYVQLICLDKTQFQDSSLANTEGVITGWGYTKETGSPSEMLKKLQVKYYTTKDCQKTLPPDFRTYYTPFVPDKMCAGILNSNQSACQGDSGGPLAFRKEEGGDRFYVRGIVSFGPFYTNAACDATKLTLSTSVAFHKDFILSNLAKYKDDSV